MKFSAQEDLKLPQAEVFARLSNSKRLNVLQLNAMFACRKFRKAIQTEIPWAGIAVVRSVAVSAMLKSD